MPANAGANEPAPSSSTESIGRCCVAVFRSDPYGFPLTTRRRTHERHFRSWSAGCCRLRRHAAQKMLESRLRCSMKGLAILGIVLLLGGLAALIWPAITV